MMDKSCLSFPRRARMAALAPVAVIALLPFFVGTLSCASDPPPKAEDPGPKRRQGPDEPWRKEKPAAAKTAALALPVFLKETLGNGLTIIVSERPTLPIVDVRLVVHAGSAIEKAKQAGLASMAYDMLDEGAAKMDGAALSDAFSDLGTHLRVGNDREGGGLAVGVLERNLEAAVVLLSKVALKPTFDKKAFEKVRQRRLSSLVAKKGHPQSQAFEAWGALAYGENHAYGHPADGTEETLKKMKVKDASKFWSKHAGPKNSALVFVGRITLETAIDLAQKNFGKWRSKAKRPAAPKDPEAVEGTPFILVKGAPGAPQTIMYFGRPLLERGHADEIKTKVFNQIIGGMFSSRLNMNLREDKGWTYGAGSYFIPRQGKGPWLAGASIKAEHTAAAVKEIFMELERISTSAPSAAEMQLAKDNIIRSLPARFETVRAIGGAAADLFLYDLPLDHYTSLPDQVSAVSADDVVEVAKAATAKEGLIGVLVGDAELIEAPLKELGLGEVQTIAPGEVPRR